MSRPSVDGRLDNLRTQIAEDLGNLRQGLKKGIPSGLRGPLWSLGKDARWLLRDSSMWVVGAVAGVIVGILVASRRRRPG